MNKNLLPLADEIKAKTVKIRPWLVYAALLLIAVNSFVPSDQTVAKNGLLFVLGTTIFALIQDIFKVIVERLDSIDTRLRTDKPVTISNHNATLPLIKARLEEKLSKNDDVHIKIFSVSCLLSWSTIVEKMLPGMFVLGNRNPKIVVDIIICSSDLLLNWGQRTRAKNARNTLEFARDFASRYRSYFESGKISLNIYEYDNITQWHGVLINDEMLFLGRCDWQVENKGTPQARYYLQVGEREYTQYENNDRFEGKEKIDRFNNWFDAYKVRSNKIANPRPNSAVTQL